MSELFWPVLALVLIVEGLLPLLAPGLWRRLFTEMLRLRDGQLRFRSREHRRRRAALVVARLMPLRAPVPGPVKSRF